MLLPLQDITVLKKKLEKEAIVIEIHAFQRPQPCDLAPWSLLGSMSLPLAGAIIITLVPIEGIVRGGSVLWVGESMLISELIGLCE